MAPTVALDHELVSPKEGILLVNLEVLKWNGSFSTSIKSEFTIWEIPRHLYKKTLLTGKLCQSLAQKKMNHSH